MSPQSIALAGIAALALCGPFSGEALAQRERPNVREGLNQQNAPPPERREKQFPVGSSWTAIALNGRQLSGDRPSMSLDDQLRARGFAGCNNYSATAFPLREQGFAVGPVAVTRKACDQGAMALERGFLVALRTSRQWDIVEGQLILRGQGVEIRFERAI